MFEAAVKKEEKNSNSVMRNVGRSVKRHNRTEIPIQLKERMERTTGLSFDDVRVHYNSSLPAKLDALAYTKGNQIEIGPGQEGHLPHELGHVVQQKLGMVRANAVHSDGTPMNTDPHMEHQADEIGDGKGIGFVQRMRHNVIQRCGAFNVEKKGNYVVRGGPCKAHQFINGSKEKKESSGEVTPDSKLSGISVNYAENTSAKDLSSKIPHDKMGVTEKSVIDSNGGKLEATEAPGNQYHHELSELSANQLQDIFKNVIENPTPKNLRPQTRNNQQPHSVASSPQDTRQEMN